MCISPLSHFRPLVFGLSSDVSTEGSVSGSGNKVSSKRTSRHKSKVNYLEMLRGEEKEKTAEDSIMETIESVAKSLPSASDNSRSKKKLVPNGSSKKKAKSKDKKNKSKKDSKLSKKLKIKKKEKGPKLSKEKHHSIERVKSSKKTCDKKYDTPATSDLDSEDELAKSKFKPLKVKVGSLLNFAGSKKSASPGTSPSKKQGGLFSRSNSSSSSSSPRVRVLAVAHQSAFSGDEQEARLPSQPAEIHLDLFTRASSPCVRCQTCSQFLSVPDFMRHHHVNMDNEWLATEAAHRVLVPRNQENISESEKKLWEEFHRLQESFGGFGGDEDEEDTDSDDNDYEDGDDNLDVSGTSSSILSLDRSPRHDEVDGIHLDSSQVDAESHVKESTNNTAPSFHEPTLAQKLKQQKQIAASKLGFAKQNSHRRSFLSSTNGIDHNADLANLRTSSRKRKSKQLFSIENYYTPRKQVNGEDFEMLDTNSNASVVEADSSQAQLP